MHNKTSCRSCGGALSPASRCEVCNECVSWVCASCEGIEDVTHSHYLPAAV